MVVEEQYGDVLGLPDQVLAVGSNNVIAMHSHFPADLTRPNLVRQATFHSVSLSAMLADSRYFARQDEQPRPQGFI